MNIDGLFKNVKKMENVSVPSRRDILNNILKQYGYDDKIYQEWKEKAYPVDEDATARMLDLCRDKQHIHIIGDYDCDGICSSWILNCGLSEIFPDKDIRIRIPRRMSEGYGVNEKIIDEIETEPEDTVILTCDNGIAAVDVFQKAKEKGFTVIITDHHHYDRDDSGNPLPLPPADYIVNPKAAQVSNPLPCDNYCGAGVVYKLLENKLSDTLRKELSVYAGLATVADVMTLQEENWVLVRNTIQKLRNKDVDLAIRYLMEEGGQSFPYANEDTFGFFLGPVFNAAGRIMDDGAMDVIAYLKHPTREQAAELIAVNEKRQKMVKEQGELAESYIRNNGLEHTAPIWIGMNGLHQGILGIIAGNLAEKYKVPVICLTKKEDGTYKGSARSYGDFNIYEYLNGMREDLLSFGGHPGAAGLSLDELGFMKCKDRQISIQEMNTKLHGIPMELDDIPYLFSKLEDYRPFGEGNPTPLFETDVNLDKENYRYLKDIHLSVERDGYKLMSFSHKNKSLSDNAHFHTVGKLKENVWNDKKTIQFICDDVYNEEER